MPRSIPCFMFVILFCGPHAPAADWPQFRGPGGLAISDDTGLPVSWSQNENVAWKTELPGLGTSSPITLADRIFLTCYSGYGVEPNEGRQQGLRRHVVCLARKSGKILWIKDFRPALPESEYSGGNNSKHGYTRRAVW